VRRVRWIVDGNNVMGAGADGWWNDPVAAATRLTQSVAEWTNSHGDAVTLVFDGRPEPAISELAGGLLTVDFARRLGRDAADDRIVEIVEDIYANEPDLRVVTSDRGLSDRLPPGVDIEGAGRFRTRLGLAGPGGSGARYGRQRGRGGRPGRGRR
jgi:predicted RNA-binding protein with PIN domain